MKIGFVYDLRSQYLKMGYSAEETAEFDKEETIQAIEKSLKKIGHTVDRIGNLFSLTKALNKGNRWDFVFNIAEGMFGLSRESVVPAILDAYKIPYTFSDPLILAVCLHKGITKTIARANGVLTPDFAVLNSIKEIDDVNLKFPLFVKPVAEGTSKGISDKSKVNSKTELLATCKNLFKTHKQPLIVEEYLPGREFTVGILGSGKSAKSLGVMEILSNKKADNSGYTYFNKQNYEELIKYELVKDKKIKTDAENMSLKIWSIFDCKDAGRVDLRADSKGRLQFIEVNPLPGLNPIHSDLPILCRLAKIDYNYLISSIFKSATKRLKK